MASNRKTIITYLKGFLLFDACITAFLFATLGVEGMALLTCNFYEADVCQDLRETDAKEIEKSKSTENTAPKKSIARRPVSGSTMAGSKIGPRQQRLTAMPNDAALNLLL